MIGDDSKASDNRKIIRRGTHVTSIYGGQEWIVCTARVRSDRPVKLIAVDGERYHWEIITVEYDEFIDLYRVMDNEDDY